MSLKQLMTSKQQSVLLSYLHDDWRYLILSGAVRSGKTYIDNYLFLLELKRVRKIANKLHDPHPQYILAGFSSNTIFDNIISSLGSQFGLDLATDRHRHYTIFGIDIVPAYTGSVRGMAAIRGMTAYGAYINEASLATHEVFQEIIDRCSIDGARIICDTNPDNPEHWLKKDYIDNQNPEARIKSFHFTLDDNPTLPSEYVKSLKVATPTGMFYDRRILGLWVSGEGAVYKDFDKRKMVISDDQLPKFTRMVAGVDWGYDHCGSIVVFGVDDDGRWYLVEEHTSRYKEISYWTRVAKDIQQKYGQNIPFYCDTARPEHIDHFTHAGINARYGWKSVVAGIELVAELMKTSKFFVKQSAPVKFMDEIYNYRWNDKQTDHDAVIKENDDVMDACRYAIATELHKQEQIKNYPKTSHQNLRAGMDRFGL